MKRIENNFVIVTASSKTLNDIKYHHRHHHQRHQQRRHQQTASKHFLAGFTS